MNDELYSSGNYEKHTTKNPLKRILVKKLNDKIIKKIDETIGSDKIEKNFSILDAGCGEGFTCKLIKSNFSKVEIVGIDYSKPAIEYARNYQRDLTFVEGDINNMPFGAGTYDMVLCSEVLEHIVNPEIALNEVMRVAKKWVILTVPHEPWFRIGNMLSLKNCSRLGNPIDHVNHWSCASFKKFVYRNLEMEGKYFFSFPWIIAVIKKY